MNNNFCVIPFMHLHINNFGKMTPCCINHMPLGDTKNQTIESVWNGSKMNRFRQAMLNGEKPTSCETCYNKELGGAESLRMHYNEKFSKFIDRNIYPDPKPVFFDIRFSNLCNMKCRICWHGASSLWFDDAKKMGMNMGDEALITSEGIYPLIEQIEQYINYAEDFYFAGGEPLVMEQHYQILQMLIKHDRKNVRLIYNTNFMILGLKHYDLFELWNNFEEVFLNISIDEVLDRADYIRKGSSYPKLLKNRQLLRERAPHVSINVSPTINVLNIYTLCNILKQLVVDDFATYDQFHFNILHEHPRYNIKILPLAHKEMIRDRIENFISAEELPKKMVDDLRIIITYMFSEDWSEHLSDFKAFNDRLDELRGESLSEVYQSEPELISLVEEF